MGCGPSTTYSSAGSEVQDRTGKDLVARKTHVDKITLPNHQQFHITVSPASSIKISDNHGTYFTTIECTEKCLDKPKTDEEGEFQQAAAAFDNGQLGVKDHAEIKALLNALPEGHLFEDSHFPADDSSLFFSGRNDSDVIWKRPSEMVAEPQLFVSGVSRSDVVQGSLGDCWFLSSCSAIAKRQKLIERVIGREQVLWGSSYQGLVVVQFWRFGDWVSVYIDDRLPTRHDALLYARCPDTSEFWVALLEKAYAKLHGSYEALEGGQSMDALVDLTGGLAERFDLADLDQPSLFKQLYKASRAGAFITCSRKGNWQQATVTDSQGLVQGHAYTVTSLAFPQHEQLGPLPLVRIRNPWADDSEWNGAWADGDERWAGVSDEDKTRMAVQSGADGEFWMEFKEFCQQFEEVSLCTMGPDFDENGKTDYIGQMEHIQGRWIAGRSAGGSRNDFDRFTTNPQYLLTIHSPDPDDEDEKASVLITLLQEYRRSQRQFGIKMAQIGFLLYKVLTSVDGRLSREHFMYNYEDASSGSYINYREVSVRQELEAGHYVIVPATFHADTEASFMIRAFCSGKFQLSELI